MSPDELRALGVDLGDARIGLALSDVGLMARPLETLTCVGPRKDLQRVAERARELEVSIVVVGLPLLPSGQEGDQAAKCRRFAEGLERRLPGVRVELRDERLTTVEAERTMRSGGADRRRRRSSVDAIAAALILQGFLDERGEGS